MRSTPRLTRAGPARPLGGRILSLLQSRHTQSMPLRLPHWSLWVSKPSMTSAASARTPGPASVRPPQTGFGTGPERTPFNGPHDYALRRPVAPLSQLAYLRWNARPGGQTCRAQHCSSGWKEGKYAKPRKASPKYGGISIHLLSYLTNPGRNLGVSGRARRQIRAQATASFGYHRNRFSSCVPQYLPREGGRR